LSDGLCFCFPTAPGLVLSSSKYGAVSYQAPNS
jgi:hypothetical protein